MYSNEPTFSVESSAELSVANALRQELAWLILSLMLLEKGKIPRKVEGFHSRESR